MAIFFILAVAIVSWAPMSAFPQDLRIYVITDLEGPAGVEHWEQTRVQGPAKSEAMSWLTEEVNAAVDGILDAAPGAIMDVWDGHGNGGILKDKLHPNARYLKEEEPRKALIEGAYSAVFFVGQHAMAGTPFSPLAHTYSSRSIAYYRLNGILLGEFGARTALAGSRGIPVLFVSGDDKAVLEARMWIPGITGVAVKQGRGIERAEHLSHEEACLRIRKGAAEACEHRAEIQPLRMDPPYRLEIRYYEPIQTGPQGTGKKVLDSRTIEIESLDLAKLPI